MYGPKETLNFAPAVAPVAPHPVEPATGWPCVATISFMKSPLLSSSHGVLAQAALKASNDAMQPVGQVFGAGAALFSAEVSHAVSHAFPKAGHEAAACWTRKAASKHRRAIGCIGVGGRGGGGAGGGLNLYEGNCCAVDPAAVAAELARQIRGLSLYSLKLYRASIT
jgi:hypothetical protein